MSKLDGAYLSSDIHQGHSRKLKTLTCNTLTTKNNHENVSVWIDSLISDNVELLLPIIMQSLNSTTN